MALPDLPPLSGDLCIRALVGAGWLPVGWTDGRCTLARGSERLVVPRLPVLDPSALAHLIEGRVLPLEFIRALEQIYARDLARLRPGPNNVDPHGH